MNRRHPALRLAVLLPVIAILSLLATVLTPLPSANAASPKTVTFSANGGTGSMSPQTDNHPTALDANTFTRSGYTFTGWNTSSGGGGTPYADGATYSFASNITLYAQWTPLPNHTVTFDANGGSGSMSPQVTNVPTALTSNTFTRLGYTFAGWNTVALGGGTAYADGATYSFATNITLYAQWTPLPNHTVTFDANSGSGSMSPQVTNVPTALTSNAFTRLGYSFDGWNTIAGGGGTAYADGASYNFDADVTLFAQWTPLPNHTATFDANSGNGSMAPQVTNIPTALIANTFTRLGYTFAGWDTVALGGGTAYADGASFNFDADVTLFAQWTPLPNHTVTFDANSGDGSMAPQIANIPTALTSNTFTRLGYTFAGWDTVALGGGTAYADGASYNFDADVTLFAQWTALPIHIVTFVPHMGEGTMSPQLANVPTALKLNTYTRVGYAFTGWNTEGKGGATPYADGEIYSFEADLILFAQWAPLPNFTVTFDANSGDGSMAPQASNIPIALTTNAFTRTGYTFTGWDTFPEGGGIAYADGATYNFDEDVTLFAQWTALPTHTVTFDSNGGSGSMSPQSGHMPTALNTNTFTHSGYTFAGWNTESNGSGTSYADGAVYDLTADLTLYAEWTAVVAESFSVTFNANGGSGTMAPQTANAPTALTLNAFTRTGYTFAGWNTVALGGGTAYANGVVYDFTANATLFAQWIAVVVESHTVIFDANGGSGTVAPQIANVPTALTLNAFTRTGYTFTGWNTVALGGGTAYADGAVYSFAADVTLFAQWTAVVVASHTVTFFANGGLGSMSPQASNVPAALSANAFALTGYNFVGWNTLPTGVGTAYANGSIYSFAADMILYAQWNLIVVTPVYVPPVTATPAPPAAPPAPIAQAPLVLTAIPTQLPIGSFSALITTGGSGNGVVTYATSTPADCVVDSHGLVTGLIAGICTVIATKAADGTYLASTSAPVNLTFTDLLVTTAPEPPAASPTLPATGLMTSVARTVKVYGSKLSKSIKISLGAALGGKKATVQIGKVGTKIYRSLSVVMLNKAGFAQLTRQVPSGSAIRVLVGGRSLAATIVR